MRIAMMPHSYFPNVGGTEVATYQIAKGLKERGHEVIIVTHGQHYFKRAPTSPLHEAMDDIEVYRCDFVYPYISAGLKPAAHFLISFPITWARLLLIMRNFRPDVVNIQFLWTNAFYFLLVKPFLNCALVVTAQGPIDVRDRANQPKPRLWQFLRRSVLAVADAFTANSGYTLNDGLRIHSKKEGVYRVIPNPVLLEESAPTNLPNTERSYIFTMGRLHRDKGFDVLIRAFADLACRHPGVDLVIAGEGPARESLSTLVENLGLNGRVRLPGTVWGEDKNRLLHGCALFVLPSRIESFGTVLAEAMACGKAVVVSQACGIVEFIEDGTHGLLVRPEDPVDLARAMERLLTDRELRTQMGQANRRLVEDTFSWSKIVDQYEKLFREVLARRWRR